MNEMIDDLSILVCCMTKHVTVFCTFIGGVVNIRHLCIYIYCVAIKWYACRSIPSLPKSTLSLSSTQQKIFSDLITWTQATQSLLSSSQPVPDIYTYNIGIEETTFNGHEINV